MTELLTGTLGMIGGGIVLIFVVFMVLLAILKGFCLIGANQVGILTKNMFGKKMPEGQIIARHGEVGVQAQTLMPGLYWRFPIYLVIYQSPGRDGGYFQYRYRRIY